MSNANQMLQRPRRNRASESMRGLIRETSLEPRQLIYPIFVQSGVGMRTPIASMPGQCRVSIDEAVQIAASARALGIAGLALFPLIEDARKDRLARESANPDGLLQRAIKEIKNTAPELLVVADVAMDPYSTDGHDGLLENGRIVNDATLDILATMAVAQARAGADVVAPSDMMDGRVGAIRRALDASGFQDVAILSYAAKYASCFYGPFREALDSAPRSGDKKTYQMDPANRREAIRETQLDEREGADIVMVKPAGAYLDVIAAVRACTTLPLAAYQVSGEYAMIKAAAANGWLDEAKARDESLLAIRRAGADAILTYFALDAAKAMRDAH